MTESEVFEKFDNIRDIHGYQIWECPSCKNIYLSEKLRAQVFCGERSCKLDTCEYIGVI